MGIFLSYSREDSLSALTLAAELETAGLNLFRDPPTLTGDPFWRDRVATQLAASDATIVLWSNAAQASPWVDQEIRAYSGPILFILMDETPLRQYGSKSPRCCLAKKTDALNAVRSLLAGRPMYYDATANDCRLSRAQDEALFTARWGTDTKREHRAACPATSALNARQSYHRHRLVISQSMNGTARY